MLDFGGKSTQQRDHSAAFVLIFFFDHLRIPRRYLVNRVREHFRSWRLHRLRLVPDRADRSPYRLRKPRIYKQRCELLPFCAAMTGLESSHLLVVAGQTPVSQSA